MSNFPGPWIFFRRKDLLKSKHRGLAISFFIDIIILLLILSWKTINTPLKGESTMNDIPPIQDPKHNYCLSYEGKEKADVLNKYFCSITNLVDENKTLPDFDDRGGNVLETIWMRIFCGIGLVYVSPSEYLN
jgi:hypothetical protein